MPFVDLFPFVFLILFEIGCIMLFLRFGLRRGTPKQRLALLSLVVLGVVMVIFLSIRMVTPVGVWLDMMDNPQSSTKPYGRRNFTPLFWPISLIGFIHPFVAAKFIGDDLDHPNSVSLNTLRFSFFYFLLQFYVMGCILN